MTPNTEAQLRSEAARGQHALELMADDLMVEAFGTLTARLTDEWANSPARDTAGREQIWLMRKLLQNVQNHLSEIAQTGQMAALQMEQERTRLQRVKDWARESF